MRFKTKLILICAFLFHIEGKAELIGGYDQQRLAVISEKMLQRFYIDHPFSLTVPKFPVSLIEDTSEFAHYYQIFTILVEERVLTATNTVVEQSSVSASKQIFMAKRQVTFDYAAGNSSQPIALGEPVIGRITQIRLDSTDKAEGRLPFTVYFEWQLLNSPDWLWATTLKTDPVVAFLLSANSSIKSGFAKIHSVDEEWQFVQPPNLFVDYPIKNQ